MLRKISEEMKQNLAPFINESLTPSTLDAMRQAIMGTLEQVHSRHEISSTDYTKWVSLRRDPEDRNKVILTLHDPYNAPAWLRQVFEQMSQP